MTLSHGNTLYGKRKPYAHDPAPRTAAECADERLS
jgi:hypothetical protein